MTGKQSTVELARSYLACSSEEERAALRDKLDAYQGNMEEVVHALRQRPVEDAEKGWIFSRQFRKLGLVGKYPEQPFSLYVPPHYDPAQPIGLLIFLHGGGRGRGDNSKHIYDHGAIADLLEECGRIVVFPSAPPNDHCWARWHLPETDEYLADLIDELEQTYAIDADNVVLAGTSMGGMGALHMAHRWADRLASVLSSSATWDLACWASLHGTTLWILHGVNDACLFRRRHGTDVALARLAWRRLQEAGVSCVYREHSGGHALCEGRVHLREWLHWCRGRRRDPFYPHVVAVSPRGLTPWCDWRRHRTPLVAYENHTDFHSVAPAPHSRWVTIEGVGQETVIFDMPVMSDVRDDAEEDWDNFRVELRRKHVPAGLVEAVIRDDRVIEVTPKNVTAFTLWLHPRMVDLNDVRVLVRGVERFRGPVKPSLSTLLDSYRRRRDWGLLYPARLTIRDEDNSWATPDQLKIYRP